MYCKGFIKGFNHGFQYCSNTMGSSCLLNGTCQRNNYETGFKEETRSICSVFCEVEPNEHVSELGGIEGPPKLPARFGGPILRYQLQRTSFFSTRQSSSSVEEQQLYQLWLHGASCLSAMLQVGSMPIIQSMPCSTHAMLRGAPLVRVNHSEPRAPGGLPDVFRSNRHRGFVGHRSLCDVLRAAEHRHGTPWPWRKR